MSAKKGLGRGFESLIPTDLLDESFDPSASDDGQSSDLRQIKIDQIVPDPDQPRRKFDQDELQELAASIAEHGVLQPIIVSPHGDGYQIIAGERRYRASKIAGLDKIPALVRTVSDQHRLEASLIENLQRSDLNAFETAMAYARLKEQFNLTLEEIGKRVGNKSVSAVSNTLRLLKLPKTILVLLAEGKISEGQARPLIGLDDGTIKEILANIEKKNWSARTIERYVASLKKTDNPEVEKTPRYAMDETHLAKRYGVPVAVKVNSKGAGRIVLKFSNNKEFEYLKKMLG